MRTIVLCFTAVALHAIGLTAARADDSGGALKPEQVSCRPFDADGKPTRILSTNDICPQLMFWRQDCKALVSARGADPSKYEPHCLQASEFRRYSY